MTEKIREVFSDYDKLILFTSKKKENYISRQEDFMHKSRDFLKELLDREASSEEKAEGFCDAVADVFGKRGKLRRGQALELGFFMIYYVFPSFLLIGGEEARPFLNTLRDTWNRRFKQKMNYSDYDSICASFYDTLLGFRLPEKDKDKDS